MKKLKEILKSRDDTDALLLQVAIPLIVIGAIIGVYGASFNKPLMVIGLAMLMAAVVVCGLGVLNMGRKV